MSVATLRRTTSQAHLSTPPSPARSTADTYASSTSISEEEDLADEMTHMQAPLFEQKTCTVLYPTLGIDSLDARIVELQKTLRYSPFVRLILLKPRVHADNYQLQLRHTVRHLSPIRFTEIHEDMNTGHYVFEQSLQRPDSFLASLSCALAATLPSPLIHAKNQEFARDLFVRIRDAKLGSLVRLVKDVPSDLTPSNYIRFMHAQTKIMEEPSLPKEIQSVKPEESRIPEELERITILYPTTGSSQECIDPIQKDLQKTPYVHLIVLTLSASSEDTHLVCKIAHLWKEQRITSCVYEDITTGHYSVQPPLNVKPLENPASFVASVALGFVTTRFVNMIHVTNPAIAAPLFHKVQEAKDSVFKTLKRPRLVFGPGSYLRSYWPGALSQSLATSDVNLFLTPKDRDDMATPDLSTGVESPYAWKNGGFEKNQVMDWNAERYANFMYEKATETISDRGTEYPQWFLWGVAAIVPLVRPPVRIAMNVLGSLFTPLLKRVFYS